MTEKKNDTPKTKKSPEELQAKHAEILKSKGEKMVMNSKKPRGLHIGFKTKI